jgi:broad specificity phosphatase PhoE
MNSKSDLIFVRHGKLSLPYADHSEMPFSVLADLGLGTMNPPLDATYTNERIRELAKTIDLHSFKKIYASPSPRCQETAALIAAFIGTDISIETRPELSEVHFDLYKLDETMDVKKEIELKGIAAVNTAVFRAMVSGIGAEPIEQVYERVERFFQVSGPENTIAITHDFVMRIIEIYIRRAAEFTPLTVGELEATQRNSYLSGFLVQGSSGTLRSI